jgi:hypothetical protein
MGQHAALEFGHRGIAVILQRLEHGLPPRFVHAEAAL